jgi:hypothetical protein
MKLMLVAGRLLVLSLLLLQPRWSCAGASAKGRASLVDEPLGDIGEAQK